MWNKLWRSEWLKPLQKKIDINKNENEAHKTAEQRSSSQQHLAVAYKLSQIHKKPEEIHALY